MTTFTPISPERVREIASQFSDELAAILVINAATPEIARATLEWAAQTLSREGYGYSVDRVLQMAKEITDAK